MDLYGFNRALEWLDGPYDPAVKAEIRQQLLENPKELGRLLSRSFLWYRGNARHHGNRDQPHEYLYHAEGDPGLCQLSSSKNGQKQRVFIGYDVRINSRLFAEESARVLAGNGIEVPLTKDICPLPASYACRLSIAPPRS